MDLGSQRITALRRNRGVFEWFDGCEPLKVVGRALPQIPANVDQLLLDATTTKRRTGLGPSVHPEQEEIQRRLRVDACNQLGKT
jgi:hypothetical protein